MPMGDASIKLARRMPSASTVFTGKGSFSPAQCAASPGIRLSSTSVVFPEPDTPVTAVSLPLGITTFSACTVWIGHVSMRIVPSRNTSAALARLRIFICPVFVRKGAILDAPAARIFSMLPWARMVPP